ncbi:acetyltransferase [Acaryochloris marina MBIC10699]|nr:acyltransferase [Acaryochloris marina]BDM77601.1 acetyltransferase [Acaryochloris marina MBIC10699]
MLIFLKSLPYIVLQALYKVIGLIKSMHYRSIATIDCNAKIFHTAKVINIRGDKLAINIGSKTHLLGELLTFGHAGHIQVGEDCYVGENSRIWSANKVEIGNRVLISHNVNIHDTDGHPLNKQLRYDHFLEIVTNGHPKSELEIPSSAIQIHNDVWIGFNATVLKGVTIGEGAVIGAASVVTKDVPPHSIYAGNPACFIRWI